MTGDSHFGLTTNRSARGLKDLNKGVTLEGLARLALRKAAK